MATLERQQSNKGKKQKQRKSRGKTNTGGANIANNSGGGGGGSRKGRGKGSGGGGLGLIWDALGDLGVGVGAGGEEEDVSHQLEALRRRLSALDSELRESKQDTERTLQDIQQRREQELHLIKDLGEWLKEEGAGEGSGGGEV